MHAVIGALLLAVTVVLFQFAYVHHRKPVPSRWTRHELASQVVCFAILTTLTAGVGLLGDFLMSLGAQPFGLSEAGLILVIVAIAALPVGAMGRYWRRQKAQVVSGSAGVHALRPTAASPDSGLPPHSGAGGHKPRRAA